jgi:hypothetical protein
VSTESIASPQPPPASASGASACPACGSPLAADQRYCLECGERQPQTSEFLRSSAPVGSSPPASPPSAPSGQPAAGAQPGRNSNTVSLLAGVGVLLLALGVGVLIGRSGASSKQSPAPVQVVTAGGVGTGSSTEASFTGDWPSGTSGYTVQLQTLPVTGTTVASVAAAKAAAGGKGAPAVGALKSEEFASLSGENYVIYSGDFHKQSEAQKALATLKKNFPGAKVIHVSESGSGGSGGGGGGSGSGGASHSSGGSKPSAPSSLSKPAPSSALPSHKASGKKFEEESAKLPNVVSTG